MLKVYKYKVFVLVVLNVMGFLNVFIVFFGGYVINFVVIIVVICMSFEVDKDLSKCYWVSIVGGVFYIIMVFFVVMLVGLVVSLL